MSKDLISQISANVEVDDQEVLFETATSSICQSDHLEKFILNFQGQTVFFRVCELISFRRKIQNIDLNLLLASDTADVEILSMPHCDRIFVFSIFEVLELRELLSGTFAMLELNSLIHREIVRKIY